ncbi:hypothetical protein FO519_000045 [Halicephalobus sp. NKZ332]|nr:hypothetical protein FO519_000045 [Halicephalobus sp. NKZ332]
MSNQKQSRPNNNRRDHQNGGRREFHGKTNIGNEYGRPRKMDTLFDMIRPLLPPGEFEGKPTDQTGSDPVNDGQSNVDGTKGDSIVPGVVATFQGVPHDMNNNAEGGNPSIPQRNKGPHNGRGRGRRFHQNNYQVPMSPYQQQYYSMPMTQPTTPPEHIAVGRSVVGPSPDGNYYIGRIMNVDPFSQFALVQFMPSGNCWPVTWGDLQPYSA